jgi:magnesium transporter
MLRTHILHADGRVDANQPVEVAFGPQKNRTVWVDIQEPTEEELALLSERWYFHRLAIEDVTHLQRRSKYERYPTHTFIVTQALDRSTPDEALDTIPVSLFLRPGLMVSVHHKDVAALATVHGALAAYPERVGTEADRLLHSILDAVIDEYTVVLYDYEERVDQLEIEAVDHVKGVVGRLVAMRRDLLILRRLTLPQIEVVRRFVDADDNEANGARIWFRDVLDHLTVIQEHTAQLLEIVGGALQVHSNAVNERLNMVMKYLAVVSTLLLPWTVISGIFGMNFDVIPIMHQPVGFWVAIGMMTGLTVVLLLVFRLRKWI